MNINNFSSSIARAEKSIDILRNIQHEEVQHYAIDLATQFNEFKEGGEALIKEGKILKIGIVGQVKAGKSSFLNSLMFDGESILPKASTPMTAGLTVLEYGDNNCFEVEYYDTNEWKEFVELDKLYQKVEKEVRANKDFQGAPESFILKEVQKRTNDTQQSAHELLTRCSGNARQKIGAGTETVPFSDVNRLQTTLNQYVGAEGEYTSVVKSLYIHLHDERLKDIRIVDTPGVNDPIVSRENRTHQFLHSCHGVFFLSSASRFFDSKDMSFMNTRIGNKGVGTVVLLASKYDSVLQDLGLQLRGTQHEGDLEYADDLAQRNLKKRFEENRQQLENRNVNIQFDTTSGISYSIATKKESEWDEVEANVVKQMKAFYPDAFSSIDEANDTFLMLANVEEIKNKYLDATFIKDKDSIIRHKMSEYFISSTQQICSILNDAKERVCNRLNELNSVELEDLHTQLKAQDHLFECIKGDITKAIGKFQNSMKGKVKELYERIPSPQMYSVPTMNKEVEVSHKGEFWGTNTLSFPATVLDTNGLKQLVIDQVENYTNCWQKEWSNYFRESKKQLFDTFCSSITQFSEQTTNLKFSDSYYRNLMETVLDEIDSFKVLSLKAKKEELLNRIANYCDSQDLDLTNLQMECKKSGVQAQLNDTAKSICNQAQKRVQQEFKPYIDEVKAEADQCAKAISDKMEDLKARSTEKLKDAGKDYIEKLEEDIKNKQSTQSKLEEAQKIIETISNLINE
ncbi:MAG: dynamin family protein [Lachnospiraceae bacterium]|nr:dynamin family protein [Lachnospiraceae bacterium]